MEPENPCYNVHKFSRFTGILHVAVLEQAFNEILRRHEALSTTFSTIDGKPVQIISPERNIALAIVDLRELSETSKKAEANRLATTELQRPFDMTKGPLLRSTLLYMDDKEHILLPTMHHIVSDCWSMEVLYRESVELYKTFSAGEPSSLPELSIQYADFAHWQRQWLQGEVLEKHLSFWKQQLAGELPVLELPADRPRPLVRTFRGATHSFTLPESLSKALNTLSQQENVTIFMTLLAAFKVLLHRYTGQDDIIVGTLIANRDHSDIQGLIGFFVNTLVLRTDLSGNPSFRELLDRVREVALGAYAHKDLPFGKLVEELQPERYMSHSPLFQVMFILQNVPAQAEPISSPFEVASRTTEYDLTLRIWETPNGLAATFKYNTDLFDVTTIIQMFGHFRILLEGIVADPEQCISTLPFLSKVERKQLLSQSNLICPDHPFVKFEKNEIEQSLPKCFEKQVKRYPDKIATKANLEVLPLTPNSRVDRKALPVADRTGLEAGYVAPRTSTEKILAGIWADVLGLEKVGIYDNFFGLGGDSLLCFQVAGRAAQSGLFVTLDHLFQHQTIAELSEAKIKEACFKAERNAITGPVPLTPIQHWLLERQLLSLGNYSDVIMLELNEDLAPSVIETAVQSIWEHHDVLRTRFWKTEQDWQQFIVSPKESPPFFYVNLSSIERDMQNVAVDTIVAEIRIHLDLSKMAFIIVFLDLGPERHRHLLITIHHLIFDVVTGRILLEDFDKALRQLSQGKTVCLPQKTTSFKCWAERLASYAQSSTLHKELNEYWLKLPWDRVSQLPVDNIDNKGNYTYESGRIITSSLHRKQTAFLLDKVWLQFGAKVEEILLFAICRALALWANTDAILLDLTRHGREEQLFDNVDLTRTTGFFLLHAPVVFHWNHQAQLSDALHLIQTQYHCIPNGGIGYGLLRYLNRDSETAAQMETLPKPQIRFLYHGQRDKINFDSALFHEAKRAIPIGSEVHPQDHPGWLLNFHARILNGRLEVACKYLKTVHRRSTAQHLMKTIINTFELLMESTRQDSRSYYG